LPQHQKAIVPIEKLRDYALDGNHPLGKSKARVFKATLGMGQDHAEVLAKILQSSLFRSPAVRGHKDRYGERWTTYHEIIGLSGQPVVVTAVWIYRIEQGDVPVLISCYIEPQGPEKLAEALKVG
jgi:filamentous hemagglutinin